MLTTFIGSVTRSVSQIVVMGPTLPPDPKKDSTYFNELASNNAAARHLNATIVTE